MVCWNAWYMELELTSNVGFKNRNIYITVKINGAFQKLRDSLEFCYIAHYKKGVQGVNKCE
jgi:hypothetical protein